MVPPTIAASSHPSHHEQETKGEATSRSKAGRPHCACGVSANPSCHPRDDVAASLPEAQGGCRLAAVSSSPRFSPVGSLPQNTLCSDVCSTMTE
jgi:hypothetical protein